MSFSDWLQLTALCLWVLTLLTASWVTDRVVDQRKRAQDEKARLAAAEWQRAYLVEVAATGATWLRSHWALVEQTIALKEGADSGTAQETAKALSQSRFGTIRLSGDDSITPETCAAEKRLFLAALTAAEVVPAPNSWYVDLGNIDLDAQLKRAVRDMTWTPDLRNPRAMSDEAAAVKEAQEIDGFLGKYFDFVRTSARSR